MFDLSKSFALSVAICCFSFTAIGCGGGGTETTINEASSDKEQVLGDMTEEEMRAKMEADMAASRPGGK